MNIKIRLCSVLFTLLLTFTCTIPSVSALEYSSIQPSNEEIVYLQDGIYIISTIQENSCTSLYAATHTKSGSKTSTVYSASGDPLYSITVHGVFSYNGSSASANSASYSYTDESPLWSFSSGSSSKGPLPGNIVYAWRWKRNRAIMQSTDAADCKMHRLRFFRTVLFALPRHNLVPREGALWSWGGFGRG